MPDQRLTVRPFAEADAEAVLDLHNRVFAKARPRTRHHWHWKFRDNPLRATEVILAMRRDGRCVAQYAGIPSACVLNGERCRQSVQSDVAIDPEHRRGLQRTGLIVRMAELYLDRFGGRTNALLYGFPEPPLLRVGVRLLKFEVLRDVSFLVREASIPLVGAARGVSARRVPRFGAAVDALWERAKATITTATIRDAAYLNWRYADHPDVEHLLLEVSDDRSGELLGIAVLREGGWDDSIVSILECLVPAHDRDDAERLLIREALAETSRRGKRYLVAWFPQPMPEFLRFQKEYGFFVQFTPYQQAFRSYVKWANRRWLNEHWYQTMGDIDFF